MRDALSLCGGARVNGRASAQVVSQCDISVLHNVTWPPRGVSADYVAPTLKGFTLRPARPRLGFLGALKALLGLRLGLAPTNP